MKDCKKTRNKVLSSMNSSNPQRSGSESKLHNPSLTSTLRQLIFPPLFAYVIDFHAPASSKAFALTWYRALTWYCSPARPFAALDVPLLVTGQQGGPSPACRQLSRARSACAGSSSKESTRLSHGTKLGRTLCYLAFSFLVALHIDHGFMRRQELAFTRYCHSQ